MCIRDRCIYARLYKYVYILVQRNKVKRKRKLPQHRNLNHLLVECNFSIRCAFSFFLTITISGEADPLSPIRRSSISSSLPCIGLDSTWYRKRLSFSKFPYNATSMRTPRHSRKKDFSRRPLWYFIITA